RNNGEKKISFRERTFFHRLHAGLARAFDAFLAAACKRSPYRDFILCQTTADAGAHIARGDNGNGRSRAHDPVTPPSRLILWPVTNAEASDARNRTAPTRSSGTSARGMHCMAIIRSFCAGVTVLRSISVNVAPGRIAFTVMLSEPSSRAIDRLMPASAALV